MLTVFWSAKGGAGTTVLAAAHALDAGARRPTLVVDLDGDLPGALGVPDLDHGVADWLAAGAEVPADALDRLAAPVTATLSVLGRGSGPLDPGRAVVFARLLADLPRPVIVDAGTRPGPLGAAVVRAADNSVLVTRACYLAVERARRYPLPVSEVIVVAEPQRALRVDDVADALGAPVHHVVHLHPNVSRAVDSGLLVARRPRQLRAPVDVVPA